MSKYKELKEELETLNHLFDIILQNQTVNRLNIQTLEIEIAKLKQPYLHHVDKQEYEKDKIWWTKRLDEMESKLSMKFYQNEGIYTKIRMEFTDQINKLKDEVEKLKIA